MLAQPPNGTPDGAADDWFGYSVSMSGATLAVGAHQNDDQGIQSGSVYVYVRSGTVWTQQGKLKWFVHPDIETGGRQVWAYLQEIPPHSRSGKHLHVAEEQVLVIEGNGYDMHDGERWNWQAGEFICIPRMTAHQHFNSGDSRVLLLCAMPSPFVDVGLGGIEQLEDAPEFTAGD